MKKLSSLILTLLLPTSALANDLFSLSLDTEGQTTSQTFDSVNDLFDSLNPNFFGQLNSNYNESSAATVDLNLGGIEAIARYREESNTLQFTVESEDINEKFYGQNRGESINALHTYLRENENGIFTKILRDSAAKTGVDPVAGNPNSLVHITAENDYSAATSNNSNAFTPKEAEEISGRKSGFDFVGLEVGNFTINGRETKVYTLPLSYTYYFAKPGYHAKFTAPLSYSEEEGAQTYKATVGASLHIPVIKDKWSLTPALRIGRVDSEKLDSATMVNSASLTNIYYTKLGNTQLKLANMISILQTNALGGEEDYYDISNQIMKNAVSAKFPMDINLMGRTFDLQATVANTKVMGDASFVDNYNDFAISFGSKKPTGNAVLDRLRLGMTYTYGETNEDKNGETGEYKGVSLNMGYSF